MNSKPAIRPSRILGIVVAIGVISWADLEFFTNLSIVPLAIGLMLLLLALVSSPWEVLAGLLLGVGATVLVLYLKRATLYGSDADPITRITLRGGALLVTGCIAVLLANSGRRSRETERTVQRFLEALRLPVILSDSNGWIRFANSTAQETFPQLRDLRAREATLFELFSDVAHKGQTIRRYVELFSEDGPRSLRLDLVQRGQKALDAHPAVLSVIRLEDRAQAITVLYRHEPRDTLVLSEEALVCGMHPPTREH